VPTSASPDGTALTSLLEVATIMFLRTDSFATRLKHLLFLLREAGASSAPQSIGLLGFCAIFEGIVGLLHRELIPPGKAAHLEGFSSVKGEVQKFVGEQLRQELDESRKTAFKRLQGQIGGAGSARHIDKYRELCGHFGLAWEKMSVAWNAWNSHRHGLAHGSSEQSTGVDSWLAASRIAGACNVLALAAIGYKGVSSLSRLEDKYIDLP